ncbi:MAG: DUF1292 domain-containing protein [Firmicutes bacterium]|nr:DUF1292 domain-containing protein [Bacillota bacterium]
MFREGARRRYTAAFVEDNIITLVDEAGEEHDFILLEIVEIEEGIYAVLLPEEDPEEGVVVLRIEKDSEGQDVLISIDDEEFEKVREILEALDD